LVSVLLSNLQSGDTLGSAQFVTTTSALVASSTFLSGVVAQNASVPVHITLGAAGHAMPADFTGLSYESAQLFNPEFFSGSNTAWSARLEMWQWIRETLDKESIWEEARSTNLSRL
jgi:hypothetical protein